MMCSLSSGENCGSLVDDREGPVTTNLYRSTSSPPSSLTGPHVTLTLLCDSATAVRLVGSDGPVYGSCDHMCITVNSFVHSKIAMCNNGQSDEIGCATGSARYNDTTRCAVVTIVSP